MPIQPQPQAMPGDVSGAGAAPVAQPVQAPQNVAGQRAGMPGMGMPVGPVARPGGFNPVMTGAPQPMPQPMPMQSQMPPMQMQPGMQNGMQNDPQNFMRQRMMANPY